MELKNEKKGIYYEVFSAFITKSLFRGEHRIYPYKRIIREMKSGGIDLTIMFKSDELREYVNYLVPLPPLNNIVVGLNRSEIFSIKDLEYKRLGYLRGAMFSHKIDSNKKIIKHMIPDFNIGLKMLELGRIDAIIGPYEALSYAAKYNRVTNIDFESSIPVSTRAPWLQMSKKSKNLHMSKKISAEFKKIISGNILEEIRKKYREY
jgi:polar amino acid transport system substrate-binding protein